MWRIREAGPRAAATAPGAPLEWEGWDDAAVAPEKLGAYLRDLRALLDEYHYQTGFYGHFGHGCIHMRVNFDLETEDGIRKYGEFVDRAADLVVSYGGLALRRARRRPIARRAAAEDVRRRADGRVPRVQGDLGSRQQAESRTSSSTRTCRPRTSGSAPTTRRDGRSTHFAFPDDGGSIERATLRCVGLGECRKHDAGSMCPSYMVTLEEEHSTRGRAHMLFELLQGEVVRDGWQDEHVKESLDLCLSCKACKSECPTNVDIATYRAEFLSHYYEGQATPASRVRVRHDRSLAAARGRGAAAGERGHARTPGLSHAVKARAARGARASAAAAGARSTFRRWAATAWHSARLATPGRDESWTGRTDGDPVGRHVQQLLSSGNEPGGARGPSVRRVFGVDSPSARCAADVRSTTSACSIARRRTCASILDELGDAIDAGVPIVVLEPSCASVFRDELRNLFPTDAARQPAAQPDLPAVRVPRVRARAV